MRSTDKLGNSDRKATRWLDYIFCLLLPVVVACLSFIYQPARFVIIKSIGCQVRKICFLCQYHAEENRPLIALVDRLIPNDPRLLHVCTRDWIFQSTFVRLYWLSTRQQTSEYFEACQTC